MDDKPSQPSFSVIVTNENNNIVEQQQQQPVQQISIKKSKKSFVSFDFQTKEQEGIQDQETNDHKNIMLGETHPIGRASLRGRNSIKRKGSYTEEEEFIDILKKQYRTPQEIQFIEEKTKDLRFFQQINKVAANQKAQLHKRISKCLGFDYFPKGRVVFYQGDLSDTFFVLLKGNALVLLKENLKQSANSSSVLAALNKKLMIPGSSQQMTSPLMKMLRLRLMHKLVWRLINILRFIRFSAIRRHHNKNRKSFNNFDGFKKYRRSQIELQSKQPQLFGAFGVKQYAQERFTKLRKDILANIHPELDILYLENIQRFFDKQLQYFQYSASKTVEKGDSFGELGLINSKPRSATIVCLQDCYFASLTKSQYSETLREVEKHQIYKRVMFLYETLLPAQKKIEKLQNDQNIDNQASLQSEKDIEEETVSIQPFFETKIQKIQVNFSKCRLQAGQIMIMQGKPIETIYIIKKGEVSCSVQQQIDDGRTENIHIALLQRCEIVGADEILLMLEAKGNQGIVHENLMAAEQDINNEDGENTQRVVPAYQSRKVIAFCTAKVKSLYCSTLCVSSLDFRRILEDFPEMRIHLTRKAKTKLRWIEIRKKESIKLQQKLKQKRIANSSNHFVANPSHIIRDSSMMKLLSTTSLLHKTFYLKEKKQSPILPSRQLSLQNKQPQEINYKQQNLLKSKKSQKESEVKQLVRKYFSRELSQRTNKTLDPRIQTNEIVEEGLALKYGYIHSLSSTKLSPSQVVDFIFNHSENNNQQEILTRAQITHQPISQVIADIESGAINLEKEKPTHEKVSSNREVKVDYSTLGYSDEVIKRMVTRQSQIITAQNYQFYQPNNLSSSEKQLATSDSPSKQVSTPEKTVKQIHHQRYFSDFKTKNHRISQNMSNNNLLNSSNSLNNNNNNNIQQLSPQNLTEQLSGGKLSFSQQTSLGKSTSQTSQLKSQRNESSTISQGRVSTKKLSLSLEPQELERKNKLNKRIISQTLHMNKPRETYYARSYELHKTSNSMTNINNCQQEQQPVSYKKPIKRRQSCFASPLPTLSKQESQSSNIKSSTAQLNSQLSPLTSHRSSKSISSQQSRRSSNEIQSHMLPTSSEIFKPLRKTISHEESISTHPFKQLKKSRSTSKGKLEWSNQSISTEQNIKEVGLNHLNGNNQRILEFSNTNIFSTNSINTKNTNKSLQLLSPFTELDTRLSSDDKPKSAIDTFTTFKTEQIKQQQSCTNNNAEIQQQQKRFSQFFKNSNDSNKSKLSEILKKFTGNQTSTAQLSSSLPKIPHYIDCNLHHQASSSKELNIHLMRKKAETKSLLWQSHKQFYSNTNNSTIASNTSIPNQYENEPIYSKISPSFKKIVSQKSTNDQSINDESQHRNTSQSQILHTDACTNTQATIISDQKYISPEKIVILNHMGYPMSFILGGNTQQQHQQRGQSQKITMVKSHDRSIIKSILPEVNRSKIQTDTSFSGGSFIQGHKL